MVFSSAIFLFCFLPAVFLLYRLPFGRRYQNALLAAASLVFYAFGNLHYVPLFLCSILINYLTGLLLGTRCQRSRIVITFNILINLGILCVYKYTDFLIGNVNTLFGLSLRPVGLILPIGISFFTFQGLSYTIDVYRRPEEYSRSFLRLLLYISFFPQLIAGPIVRWGDISAQIDCRSCSPEKSASGIRRFIVGLSKKILLADTAAYVVDAVFAAGIFSFFHEFGCRTVKTVRFHVRCRLLSARCNKMNFIVLYFSVNGHLHVLGKTRPAAKSIICLGVLYESDINSSCDLIGRIYIP